MRRALFATLTLLFLAPWAIAPARAIDIDRVVTPLGIEVWLVRDESLPIVTVDFAFRDSGSALDPVDREGLSEMTAALLDEGAGEYDSQSFQGTLDDNAIELRFFARLDSFDGLLSTLAENLELSFDLLRLALTEPRFDAEPVGRIRAQLIARAARDASRPNTVAGRTLWRTLYPEHGYGRAREGSAESFGAITLEELRGVASRLARDRLVVAVVGDITAERLAPLVDHAFGALPARAELPAVPEIEARSGPRVKVIEKPVPQSAVAFGQPGPMRHDPDFYAAYVLNYVLGGGGFSSRLTIEVREKRGLVYSIYSYLAPLKHGAAMGGGFGTSNATVGEAMDLVRAEWRRMAEHGPTAEELAAAKTYLTGSYPLRFTDTESIAGQLVGVQLNDLGIDYMARRNAIIESVTLEDVRRVARKWLDPDKLTFVVVGEPDGVTPTL